MTDEQDQDQDLNFEIAFYEGILAQQPDFVENLVALGDAYTRVGRYAEGLAIDQRLAGLRPDDPMVLYNLACSYSLLGKLDQALSAIQSAVTAGYDEWDFMMTDADLAALRADARFKEYLASVRPPAAKPEK